MQANSTQACCEGSLGNKKAESKDPARQLAIRNVVIDLDDPIWIKER
jgi:hypothetical protein